LISHAEATRYDTLHGFLIVKMLRLVIEPNAFHPLAVAVLRAAGAKDRSWERWWRIFCAPEQHRFWLHQTRSSRQHAGAAGKMAISWPGQNLTENNEAGQGRESSIW